MPDIIKSHCNQCAGERHHDVLHSEATSWKDEQDGIGGSDTYDMLRCRGCDSIKLQHTNIFSEDEHPTIIHYPPAVARREPAWLGNIWLDSRISWDSNLEPLLREIYAALLNDSRRLAGMGVRALLEQVMTEKIGGTGSFTGRLKRFQDEGYISLRQAGTLGAMLDAGHASIHRGWAPTTRDLNSLLDITESIIETVYFHEGKAEELRKNVPTREAQKTKRDGPQCLLKTQADGEETKS